MNSPTNRRHPHNDGVELVIGPTDLQGIFRKLDAGGSVCFSLSNGSVSSEKEVSKDDDVYVVFHMIEGTQTRFSRKGMRDVLLGLRSPWYSDL